MSDGLERIVLAKSWCGFQPDCEVLVDPGRAAQLRADGYERLPEPRPDATKIKAKRKVAS